MAGNRDLIKLTFLGCRRVHLSHIVVSSQNGIPIATKRGILDLLAVVEIAVVASARRVSLGTELTSFNEPDAFRSS